MSTSDYELIRISTTTMVELNQKDPVWRKLIAKCKVLRDILKILKDTNWIISQYNKIIGIEEMLVVPKAPMKYNRIL